MNDDPSTAPDTESALTGETDGTAGAETAGAEPAGAGTERRRTGGRRRGDHTHVDIRLAITVAVGLAGGLLLASLVSSAVAKLQGLIVTWS